MYALKLSYIDKKSKTDIKATAKGITRQVKKTIKFDDYKWILFNSEKISNKMNHLRSFNHNIHLIEVEKTSLSAFDNKRFFIENSFDTLPFGHYLAHN